MSRPTTQQWAEARRQWETGTSMYALARQLGVSTSTVSRHRQRDEWVRNVPAEKRAEQTAPAVEARRPQWEAQRAEEASRAGDTARLMRAAAARLVQEALDPNLPPAARPPLDAGAVRQLAIAYGVFVDKAQLLAGSATHRFEHAELDRREERTATVLSIVDSLRERAAEQGG